MHEYYRKNLRKLKKDSDKYLHFIEREIEELFQKPYASAFDEIWNYYTEEMVEHFPYIGGDDVSGTKNLTGCMFFIAIGVVGKNYGLSTHDWGRLVTTLYERKFDKMPKLIRKITANVFRRHPAIIINALKKRTKKTQRTTRKTPEVFLRRRWNPRKNIPSFIIIFSAPSMYFAKSADIWNICHTCAIWITSCSAHWASHCTEKRPVPRATVIAISR